MAETREECFFMAKLSEKSHRYKDMMEYMEKVATVAEELTVDESRYLAAAYKYVVDALRKSLVTISSNEQEQEDRVRGPCPRLDAIKSFRIKIETEFSQTSEHILNFLETTLIPRSGSNASKALYHKIKGDCNRYLADFKIFGHDRHQEIVDNALSSYEIAQEAARAEFPPAHPLRLGVALNFAVFYHTVINSTLKAWNVAQRAYDEADLDRDRLRDISYRESFEILKRLRQNLASWTAYLESGEDD